MQKKKGFTLVEVILAATIAFMVLGVAFNLYYTGIIGYKNAYNDYDNQADIRNAMEITNNTIRYASVGFAVSSIDYQPQETGTDVTGLVKPWNYVGLSQDKKRLVNYVYNETRGKYDVVPLISEQEDLSYELIMTKPSNSSGSKMIHYSLNIYRNGKLQEKLATEVEALNALHIIDWGDARYPAIALAYRTDETPEVVKKPIAVLSMVLDTSGSMKYGLNGEGTTTTNVNGSNPVRLELLKNTLIDTTNGIFTLLSEAQSYVSLLPFSYNANIKNSNYSGLYGVDTSKFYNVSIPSDLTTLNKMVNALEANGATNTGDGMRRAYGQILNFESNKSTYGITSDQVVKNYMVVLVDGVTTAASAEVKMAFSDSDWLWYGNFVKYIDSPTAQIDGDYFTTNYNISANRLTTSYLGNNLTTKNCSIGYGSGLDTTYGEPYVNRIGKIIEDSGKVDQCFVIGYSNYQKNGVYTELESVADIAEALGIEVSSTDVANKFADNAFVFIATDKESLIDAFSNIGGYITENLWQIEGPKLN